MNIRLKVAIYLGSIAWLVYTLISLENNITGLSNGVITALVSIVNMIINDYNR